MLQSLPKHDPRAQHRSDRDPGSLDLMSFEPPAPDAAKILAIWNTWEAGEETPGRVMANLKTAGLQQLLQYAVEAAQEG
jgi:hypothetical protein